MELRSRKVENKQKATKRVKVSEDEEIEVVKPQKDDLKSKFSLI